MEGETRPDGWKGQEGPRSIPQQAQAGEKRGEGARRPARAGHPAPRAARLADSHQGRREKTQGWVRGTQVKRKEVGPAGAPQEEVRGLEPGEEGGGRSGAWLGPSPRPSP